MATENDRSRFRAILQDITEASNVPAKKRHLDIKPRVAELGSLAYEQGLLPDELLELVQLITAKTHLDQASLGTLIKNLYPVGKVSDQVVLRIVGCLGLGELKPSLAIQSHLLQWIILAYHVLDSKAQSVLSRAYGLLFNLLGISATRPQVFQLLGLLTRRKHVQHFRIQALLNLARQLGKNANLQGLLRVYRNYYPEIIVGNTGRPNPVKLPDLEWRERLSTIQRLHRDQQSNNLNGPLEGFRVNQSSISRATAGRLSTMIPLVQTSHASEKSITLEEIESAQSLALNLEKIELPDHLVAVLADPLLQKLMMLRPDKDLRRALAWMSFQLGEISNGDADEQTTLNTLRALRQFALCTKDISAFFPQLAVLLEKRIDLGGNAAALLRDLFVYIPLLESPELERLLSLVDNAHGGDVSLQTDLLEFYTKLLRRWCVKFLSEDNVPEHANSAVAGLIKHANELCLTLTLNSAAESTRLKVVEFYEEGATALSQPKILRHVQVTIPPPVLVYALLFSQSLAVVSRLCGVLAAYKQAFATAMSNAAKKLGPGFDKQQVDTFNGFLMDICNALWRGKAFVESDMNAQGCLVPTATVARLEAYTAALDDGLALSSLFTMSYSPLLCLQAIDHVRHLEEAEDEEVELRARHAGPVTQVSLSQLARKGGLELSWQDYRMGVLQHLEDKGFNGIPELMYNTMKNLRDARAKAG